MSLLPVNGRTPIISFTNFFLYVGFEKTFKLLVSSSILTVIVTFAVVAVVGTPRPVVRVHPKDLYNRGVGEELDGSSLRVPINDKTNFITKNIR